MTCAHCEHKLMDANYQILYILYMETVRMYTKVFTLIIVEVCMSVSFLIQRWPPTMLHTWTFTYTSIVVIAHIFNHLFSYMGREPISLISNYQCPPECGSEFHNSHFLKTLCSPSFFWFVFTMWSYCKIFRS